MVFIHWKVMAALTLGAYQVNPFLLYFIIMCNQGHIGHNTAHSLKRFRQKSKKLCVERNLFSSTSHNNQSAPNYLWFAVLLGWLPLIICFFGVVTQFFVSWYGVWKFCAAGSVRLGQRRIFNAAGSCGACSCLGHCLSPLSVAGAAGTEGGNVTCGVRCSATATAFLLPTGG